MTSVAERVTKGIQLLDKHFVGPSWARRISTLMLDMSDDNGCILGQLFGDFETGQIALSCTDTAEDYGFLADTKNGVTNRELSNEWVKRIGRMLSPQEGDRVVVSYEVTWPKAGYTTPQTLSPWHMRSVVVVKAKVIPEPGDRVQNIFSKRTGSVLKPNKNAPTLPGCVRVAWDVSGVADSAVVADLAVVA